MSKHKPDPAVAAHVARLQALGPVRARAMFGGHGVFLDDRMFALIADGRLYFKVDAASEPTFAAAGGEPFVYDRKGRPARLGYWAVPLAPEEAPATWLEFAELGLAAAKRQAQRRQRKA